MGDVGREMWGGRCGVGEGLVVRCGKEMWGWRCGEGDVGWETVEL